MRKKVFFGSLKEYNRYYCLALSTFSSEVKCKKLKVFKYKKDKLVDNIPSKIEIDGKVYYNVRYVLQFVSISACAFWKWKSEGKLNDFKFIKYKGAWYVSVEDLNRFIGLLVAKSQYYYWRDLGGIKNE